MIPQKVLGLQSATQPLLQTPHTQTSAPRLHSRFLPNRVANGVNLCIGIIRVLDTHMIFTTIFSSLYCCLGLHAVHQSRRGVHATINAIPPLWYGLDVIIFFRSHQVFALLLVLWRWHLAVSQNVNLKRFMKEAGRRHINARLLKSVAAPVSFGSVILPRFQDDPRTLALQGDRSGRRKSPSQMRPCKSRSFLFWRVARRRRWFGRF